MSDVVLTLQMVETGLSQTEPNLISVWVYSAPGLVWLSLASWSAYTGQGALTPCHDRGWLVAPLGFFHLPFCDSVSFLTYVGIFKDCHAKVAPEIFLENCVYDMCHTKEPTVSLCNGLQAYAESCTNAGICREWRNNTLCRECCN